MIGEVNFSPDFFILKNYKRKNVLNLNNTMHNTMLFENRFSDLDFQFISSLIKANSL